MRKTLLAAAAAFVIGGASVGSLMSYAQPAPPPPGPPGGPGVADGGWHHPGPGGWMHHWRERHRPIEPGTFALIFPQKDRNLSPSDVQTIAQAFLLWRGNHTWKVVDVKPTSDGAIGFSLATDSGSVIASFTMDPHSGHVTRTN